MKSVLISGGAGFIGSHLAKALMARGERVRVLDALIPQVHLGRGVGRDLLSVAEFTEGNVSDPNAWQRALDGIDVVFHLAAEVGVGQSMYEISRYVQANVLGTATLLELLATGQYPLKKLIVASSMSIYGEGAYACGSCGPVYPSLRGLERLGTGQWEMLCPRCERAVDPQPTSEDKPLSPTSVYAISKRDQEELCLVVGRAYGIPTVALRFFNVYGPGQSLSNPYTGVSAMFCSQLSHNNPPLVFEDGLQSRDFVHVEDIVQANLLALDKAEANDQVFNVGTGRRTSIRQLADMIAGAMQSALKPRVEGRFREGDIRHCYADITKISTVLGYQPRITLEEGLPDLVQWVSTQQSSDRVRQAQVELERRGLLKSPEARDERHARES
jgi:dTDP-L-rhamnose 4-epimerase